MDKIVGDYLGKSIISIEQFGRPDIEILFEEANRLQTVTERGLCYPYQDGRILTNLFYESSTRTSSSFAAAMQRLGGGVIPINDVTYSSVSKGENLADTVRTLAQFSDAIVLRHPEQGSAQIAAEYSDKPIINGGDGIGEHPTQALLDLYTIQREQGTLDNLRVALVGDLKHGRTVHSLAQLLMGYGATLTYVAPEGFEMPSELVKRVAEARCEQVVVSDITDAVVDQDVIYVTRVQAERMGGRSDLHGRNALKKLQDGYRITPDVMEHAPETSTLMHPLPRVGEIDMAVDKDPRAAYFRQVQNGLYIRMALLNLVLGKVIDRV